MRGARGYGQRTGVNVDSDGGLDSMTLVVGVRRDTGRARWWRWSSDGGAAVKGVGQKSEKERETRAAREKRKKRERKKERKKRKERKRKTK